MQVQAGLEIGEAGVELGEKLLVRGDVLLLLGQNAHQRPHALADRKRRGRPVVWGDTDTSRWQVAVHAASMPALRRPVK